MRALITEEFHPILLEKLTQSGIRCDENDCLDYQGVCQIIQAYDILIVNSRIQIDEGLLARAKNLKMVARMGSGRDIFDLEACKKYGIKTITAPEGNANAVAEHALAFILSAFNHLRKSQDELLAGNWDREGNRGVELCGKTISILGFGHNGSRLARLLEGFDLEILAYDIRKLDVGFKNVKQAAWSEIFQKTDVLSVHLPLDSTTMHMVNDRFIDQFKKNIYLVNISRGGICPMSTVLNQLQTGKIIKAMLDVFDSEPLVLNEQIQKFCRQNRLFITPHVAGWTHESRFKLAQILAEKIKNEGLS